jgi:sarcosine oxidase, subunit beta
LLSTDDSVAAFQRNVQLQKAHGVEVDWLIPAQAAQYAPGISVDGILAATFCAQDGIADPNGVTTGFARAAQERGVEILRGTEVTGIERAGGRVRHVNTSAGSITTPVVVNAAGPWASEIGRMVDLNVPVTPERRHIFIAQAPGGGSWDDPAHRGTVPANRILVIDFESTFYFHREGGGLLFGMGDPGERPGFDTTVRWDFLPQVIDVAVRRLPALGDAAVSHAWAGLYEMTPDHNPIIGPSSDVEGFFTIAGFSGHGFQHSPAAGRILADLMTGQDPKFDVSPFAADRFSTQTVSGEANIV